VSDPLKGLRRSIAEGKVKVLIWPADQECPVQKGQRFKIQSIEIEIETVQRKIVKGRAPEWHATFVRHEPDRVYLLRQAPPVHATHEQDHDLDSSMAERARRDGQYTSSRLTAVPNEPETVGPDWKDPNAEKRRLRHKEDRATQEKERRLRLLQRRLDYAIKNAANPEEEMAIMAGVAKLIDPDLAGTAEPPNQAA
jgi:hypothetical protein